MAEVTTRSARGPGSSDLRIYYGNTRIILPHDDPRVPDILGMVVRDAAPSTTVVPLLRAALAEVEGGHTAEAAEWIREAIRRAR